MNARKHSIHDISARELMWVASALLIVGAKDAALAEPRAG